MATWLELFGFLATLFSPVLFSRMKFYHLKAAILMVSRFNDKQQRR